MRVLNDAVLVLEATLIVIVLAGGRTAARGEQPRTDYMLHCQGCHGPDGSGAPGGVPSFRATIAKFLSVSGGREYLIRVPGTSQSELSDRRVASVLNWMVRTFDAENVPTRFEPFSADEVARLRRPPLIDVETVRQRLVNQFGSVESVNVRPDFARLRAQ